MRCLVNKIAVVVVSSLHKSWIVKITTVEGAVIIIVRKR